MEKGVPVAPAVSQICLPPLCLACEGACKPTSSEAWRKLSTGHGQEELGKNLRTCPTCNFFICTNCSLLLKVYISQIGLGLASLAACIHLALADPNQGQFA